MQQQASFKTLTLLSYLGGSMPKIAGASKVTVRFQVTIPREVREKLKVSVGDTLAFIEDNGRFYITTNA
jgi:AbrB family looped-hinge helix DNA binding protein